MHHDKRVKAVQAAFAEANQRLAGRVAALDDATATAPPPAGWSAAQIAWHVALTTELLAGAMPAMSVPKPGGFTDSLATTPCPEKLKTFPQLEPPFDASRAVKMPFGVFSLYEVGEFTAAHITRHIGQVNRTVGQA